MGKKSVPHQSAHSGEDAGELPTTLGSCLSDLRHAEETIRCLHQQERWLEARYNGLFDSLDDGFCIIEVLSDKRNRPVDYRFLKVNNTFKEQTGIENPLGRTIREIAPDHEQYWLDMYGRIAQTGESQRFEHRDEALGRFYEVHAFPIGRGELGRPQIAVLFKDIAARKRREESQAYLLQLNDRLRPSKAADALRESEENYRVIVNQSIAGISKVDRRGNIIFTNNRFCRMLGYDSSELITLGIDDIIYPEDKERNRSAFQALVAEGKPYEIEKRLVQKNGTAIWVSNHVSPIFDQYGLIVAAAIVSIDITRQKELERQKDEFIGVASHELKTPVTGIKAYSEILTAMMDNSMPTTIVQLVTRMNVQVSKLTKLIDSLLNTSRISDGQLTLQLDPLDLTGLLEECVHQGQLTTSKHRIVFTGDKLLPVLADAERLAQVLDNLISNAIKYTPKGGEILVRAEDRGTCARISVRDSGVGISKGEQPRIFNRFYRIKGTSAGTVSGIGLGLYICREIIEKHKGQIMVESVPDEGSTFYFELPYILPDNRL